MIATESDRLARTVNDILWASRLDADRVHLDVGTHDPRELARTVVEAAQVHLPAGIELSFSCEPDLPPILGDPDKVRQVLTNLVDNAVKYSPDGGVVELQIARRDHAVRFSVADAGLGIPTSEQRRIFDKFYRVDPNLTRGVGGTGLGLYISPRARAADERDDLGRVAGGRRLALQLRAAGSDSVKRAPRGCAGS